MGFIVGIDASCSKHTDMNTTLLASIGQIQSADDIAADGGSFVVFAPIYIGATCAACTVQDMSRFDSVQFNDDGFPVFHADGGALVFEQGLEVTGNPSVTAPDQEYVLGSGGSHDV
jgi:hypothetical protein